MTIMPDDGTDDHIGSFFSTRKKKKQARARRVIITIQKAQACVATKKGVRVVGATTPCPTMGLLGRREAPP